MANKTISQLTEIGNVSPTDVFPMDVSGETRKITFENLEDGIDHRNITNIGTNTHAQIDTAVTASTNHIANTSNPHSVTKSQVGLGNVDNNSLITILQSVYPVGSIYITVTSTNPATVFGFGTWVSFGAGKTLVGINAAETEFDTVEETGGVKDVTLTAAQSGLPSHSHGQSIDSSYNAAAGGSAGRYAQNNTGANSVQGGLNTIAVSAANASQAHTNLQPYIVTYMFKRTA